MRKINKKFSNDKRSGLLVFLLFLFLWTSCTTEREESNTTKGKLEQISVQGISANAKMEKINIPSADKDSGIKLFSFIEVNDTNPLNNLNFTLKKSGKPLVDIVVLFSANMNYDDVNDKVYVHMNSNVQHLLTNRAKYLQPLKEKGIKILLGIMGNHDRSGIASLSAARSKLFAKELKETCEKYDLDGVFFDDEYSKYATPPSSGFVVPSNDAAARLSYETKLAMPDKLVTVYVYTKTASFPNPVEGTKAGNFVDYAIHDYGNNFDLSKAYPGLPKSRMAMASQEFNLNRYASIQSLKNLRANGYGAHMIFAMDPNRGNFTTHQLPAMKIIAKELYDDELLYLDKPYSKDW